MSSESSAHESQQLPVAATSQPAAPDSDDWQSELPDYLQGATRTDWLLWGGLVAAGIYSLALIPFRAVLLVNYTFLYTFLTGSNLSVLTLAAYHSKNYAFLALVLIVATLSAVKFLLLYFFIGKRWGKKFIDAMFANHPPRWFLKTEEFIYKNLGFCFFLATLPFSPVPATVIVAIAGIQRAKGWVVSIWVLGFTFLLKCFYAYLGITFGPQVQDTLEVVNKYLNWVTLALIGYFIISVTLKNRKNKTI